MSKPSVIAATVVALLLVVGGGAWLLFGRAGDGAAAAASGPRPSLPLRTESVAAPSGGSVRKTVPAKKLAKPVKVSLDDIASLDDGVEVTLAPLTVRKVDAVGPGTTGGRAVIVKVTLTNRSKKSVDLGSSWVEMSYGRGRRTAALQPAPPYRPLEGTLAPGDSVSGTYPFAIGTSRPRDLLIRVTHDPSRPRAAFSGDLA